MVSGRISIWTTLPLNPTLPLNHGDLVNAVQAAQNGTLMAVDDITAPQAIQVLSPSAGSWSNVTFFCLPTRSTISDSMETD